MKAAVGVLVRQDATPLPAVAGPSSSNEDDEERSVEWCLEAVKGDDEDAVVEALGIIGEALENRRTLDVIVSAYPIDAHDDSIFF